jgi:hypothetical protein
MNLPTAATTIINPDGTRDSVRAGEAYYAGTQPGAYQVLQRGSIIAAYVVNPPASESALRAASEDRIARALPEWKIDFADDPDSWGDDIFNRRLGYEMWRPILIALLLLLIAEALAAATGSTRAAPVVAQET